MSRHEFTKLEEELVKMYDRNDVPFYVLTTDPEQSKDDVLDDVWTALDKMDGRGEVYVRHRGIVREYATESAFDRSFIIYHKYKPILYAFDTLDVDHVVIRVQNTLGMRHGKGSECIKCGDVTSCGYGSGLTRTKVCRACITRVIKTASSPSQPLIAQSPLHGFIDDAVLDAQRILEMVSTGSKNAISKTMKKLKVTTAHIRMIHRGPRGTRVSMQPVRATAEIHDGKVTLAGDMEKMHLVLSSDNIFILVSDKITKKGVALTKFEGGKFHEMRDEYPMMNAFANLLRRCTERQA
jgi:hypothetical protein